MRTDFVYMAVDGRVIHEDIGRCAKESAHMTSWCSIYIGAIICLTPLN